MPRRYSSISAVSLCVLLFISLSSALNAQAKPSSSSSVEVAYILDGSTLQTYDVDRTTGNPTQEGSGVTLDSANNTVLVPSANDEFLYVLGNDSSGVEWLWVYATDSTGVPQLPAVQALNLTDGSFSTYDFIINPNGTLAYAAESRYTSNYYAVAEVVEFTIDPTTGMVTKLSKPAATYKLNGPCLLSAEAFFYLSGFNASGTVLYDYWDCNYPFANNSANYYSRTLNQTTGVLGPDREIFAWADGNFGQDIVNISSGNLVYFSIPNNTSYGQNSVNIYTVGGKPLFSCTASMLEACGYGLWNWVDPAGKFDLIELAPDLTEVTKIAIGTKKLVDTKNYIQGTFLGFAPDDALIYTQQANQSNPWLFPIYVFDSNSGAVTYTGGVIWDNTGNGTLVPALRE